MRIVSHDTREKLPFVANALFAAEGVGRIGTGLAVSCNKQTRNSSCLLDAGHLRHRQVMTNYLHPTTFVPANSPPMPALRG
jgi:hypothetical protein